MAVVDIEEEVAAVVDVELDGAGVVALNEMDMKDTSAPSAPLYPCELLEVAHPKMILVVYVVVHGIPVSQTLQGHHRPFDISTLLKLYRWMPQRSKILTCLKHW